MRVLRAALDTGLDGNGEGDICAHRAREGKQVLVIDHGVAGQAPTSLG